MIFAYCTCAPSTRMLFNWKAPPGKPSESGPPAKLGDRVSPERVYYRQASQEALKKSAACITCPAARKRAPFIQDYLSGNRKELFISSRFARCLKLKLFYSPQLCWGGISLKHTRQKKQTLYASVFWCAERDSNPRPFGS